MKKIAIVLIILVFAVCAYFGFKAAATIFPVNNELVIANQDSKDPDVVLQQKYLLIHVNDLTVDDPELVSVWMVLVYQADPLQLMFIPLYPSYDAKVHTRLTDKFSLNPENSVSERFISQLNKSFDIQASGYLITDSIGVGYSYQWLTGKATSPNYAVATTDEEKLNIRMTGEKNYQRLCKLITKGKFNSFFASIDWTLLLPDHFATNIPFETITLTTDHIISATSPIKCDVLSSE